MDCSVRSLGVFSTSSPPSPRVGSWGNLERIYSRQALSSTVSLPPKIPAFVREGLFVSSLISRPVPEPDNRGLADWHVLLTTHL